MEKCRDFSLLLCAATTHGISKKARTRGIFFKSNFYYDNEQVKSTCKMRCNNFHEL